MKQPLFEMRKAEISYGGSPIVQDVSFKVQEGEILGIVGESGSGKSTLIKSAMGLLGSDGAVTGGELYYRGKDLLKCSAEEMRRLCGPSMGMIFQNTESALCPIRRIEEQLYESVLEHEQIGKAEIRRRALELFRQMSLKDGERILRSYPFELSGGMNQRVGIMLAMIMKPDLLFADEPTSALDVTVQAQVVREMMEMRDLYHTGIVIVTHNIGVVEYMADKIAVMYQGRMVEYGTKEQVIHQPRAEYTKKLLGSVLRIRRG